VYNEWALTQAKVFRCWRRKIGPTKRKRKLEFQGKDVLHLVPVVKRIWDTSKPEQVLLTEKLVVFFDICSSSKILEDLQQTGNLKKYRDLLITIKEFLQAKQEEGVCEMYKFIGDGWVLLFSTEIAGKDFAGFLVELAELFREALKVICPKLQRTPPVLGLTFGVDKGQLIELVMSESKEYIGRPLNIAARLQGAVKEGDDHPEYKALISKPTFDDLRVPGSFAREETKRNLRNIALGDNYECIKLVVLS
jgi:class 3 adenylate cyclase